MSSAKSPDPSPDEEEMQSAIEELEAEVKELASAIEENAHLDEGEDEDEDLLADLSDAEETLRSDPRQHAPREAPDPMVVELGDRYVHELPEPEEKIVVDLNPKPEADLLERPEKRAKKTTARPSKTGASKPSKSQLRKQARQEKRRQKKEREAARRQEAERDSSKGASSDGDDPDSEVPLVGALGMDDLEMENPLPEAAYTPGRDHADLVMDRKKRRLEAEARADKKEKERLATWERDDQESLLEKERDRRLFDVPLHVFQAVLIMLVGFLLVIGVRAAIKSMKDSEEGQEYISEETPGLKALGWLDAEKAVREFLAAPGWEAKLAYVRNPEQARPRMQRFYERHPGQDQALTDIEIRDEVNHLPLEGGAGFSFLCWGPAGGAFRVPVVRFEHEAPFWVVDWESFVAYSDVEWAPFIEAREPGSRGIFRLWVHRDSYYTPQFPEFRSRESLSPALQEDWDTELLKPLPDLEAFRLHHSIRLADPNRDLTAYGFVAKQSTDWPILNTVLMIKEEQNGLSVSKSSAFTQVRSATKNWVRSEEAWTAMVLEVGFPEEVASSFVAELEVLRFVSSNWVVNESPSKETLEAP